MKILKEDVEERLWKKGCERKIVKEQVACYVNSDGPTDGPTDKAAYRVACTQLKTKGLFLIFLPPGPLWEENIPMRFQTHAEFYKDYTVRTDKF